MDGLELSVGQSTVNQHGKGRRVVEKFFEIVKGLVHLVGRRWDKQSRRQGAACGANPILALTKLPGSTVTTTHPFEQVGVNLTDEPQAEGEILEAPNP